MIVTALNTWAPRLWCGLALNSGMSCSSSRRSTVTALWSWRTLPICPAGTQPVFLFCLICRKPSAIHAFWSKDDGSFLIFLCTPNPEGSSITVTRTTDFAHFDSPKTCLLIRDGVPWGGMESPFVVHRNRLYYLFFTHAHRHYYETVVCSSETVERFSTDNIVTTLYGHAAEVFNYQGKTFISSSGPEDGQRLNRHGLYLAQLE